MATFTGTAGANTFVGGNGIADTFVFTPATLTSTDTVTGGTGAVVDTLQLTAAGTVAATQLAHVSGLERVFLAAGNNSFTVTTALGSGSALGPLTVVGAVGNDIVNASAVTLAGRIVFASNNGADTFTGGAGSDLVTVDLATLFDNDRFQGGANTWLGDALQINQAGYLSAARLAGIAGFERLVLANGTNTVVLNNAVLNANSGRLTIAGGTGDDTVDCSGLKGAKGVEFLAGSGADVLYGGEGREVFTVAAAELDGSDTFLGGPGGGDILRLTTAGTILAADLAHIGGLGRITLANGANTLTLTNLVASGVAYPGGAFSVSGGAGNDVVDAGQVVQGRVAFFAAAGADTFLGGAGSDVVLVDPAQLNADDVLSGGANTPLGDALFLIAEGTINASQLSGVSGFERLQLANGTNVVTFTDEVMDANPRLSTIPGGYGDNTFDAFALSARHGLTFKASGGANTFIGGAGADNFVVDAATLFGDDIFVGGGGAAIDVLTLSGYGNISGAAVAGISGIERIVLKQSADGTSRIALVVTNDMAMNIDVPGAALTVVGSSAHDFIDASLVSTLGRVVYQNTLGGTFTGGGGDDTFEGGLSASTVIDGGGGDDLFRVTQASASGYTVTVRGVEHILLADGANRISFAPGLGASVNGGVVRIDGGSGSDVIDAGSADARLDISGGAGDDVLTARAQSTTLDGGIGNDTLSGGAGIDVLLGGVGSDTLHGFGGSDTLGGGGGSDRFSFEGPANGSGAAGTDIVLDFSATVDKLQFQRSAYDFNGPAFDVAIDDAAGGSANIAMADLLRLTGVVSNGATVLAYLDGNPNAPDKPLFVLAQAGDGHTFLYHVDNASNPSGIDTIADLGPVAPTAIGIGDFVFV